VDGGEENATYALAGVVSVPNQNSLLEPAAAAGDFPVVVYSHGNGGDGLTAYPYGEHFASHGWILASVNHTGNTALELVGGNGQPFARVALNRPQDVSAVIDWLETDGTSPVAGAARTEDTFLFGHSFGGYTTFAAAGVKLDIDGLITGCAGDDCAIYQDADVEAAYRAGFRDPRIKAIAPQAPAVIDRMLPGELAGLEVPTLMISGRKDITTPDAATAIPAWEGLDDPRDLWLEMPDGAHITFLTVCSDLDAETLDLFQPRLMRAALEHYRQRFILPLLGLIAQERPLAEALERVIVATTAEREAPDGCLFTAMRLAEPRLGEVTLNRLAEVIEERRA
ncbi:MAG: hypothetical protein AAFU70_14190, partial [Planctomycetota bacterium]